VSYIEDLPYTFLQYFKFIYLRD